jgi:hypothetical protein
MKTITTTNSFWLPNYSRHCATCFANLKNHLLLGIAYEAVISQSLREVEQLPQGYTASKWQHRNLNSSNDSKDNGNNHHT